MSQQKILERILKLFNLGDTSRNQSEAETLAAVTKARQLMAEYDLTEADLRALGTEKAKSVAYVVTQHTAYTRKGRTFAYYDHKVAHAVDAICSTQHYVKTTFVDKKGWYVSRRFYGAEADVAIASALFQVLLDVVRKAARTEYGSGWSPDHQSYAIGFAIRLEERAAVWNPATALGEAQSNALVVISKDKAQQIERWADTKLELKSVVYTPKVKKHDAFAQGYEDGANVDLGNPRRRIK